ncbi:MAG TPA: SDR family oxidoreductase [Beijerinckiaceae bacterium]|nr:SDR family oxidoreductase [Beijerinckiaceae bacterium]
MPSPHSRLDGKVAVVTGGTQGLGEAIGREFAARGLKGLVLCGRQKDKGEAVARDIARTGCRALFVVADLEKTADARAVTRKADAEFGRIDILVNAAGITDRGTIFDTSEDLFDRMVAVNIRSPFFLMQEAAKIMKREKIAGSIINIQSMSANGGQAFLTPYSMSKGALATLTRNVAHALVRHRIRVNGLNIGWMDTPGEDAIMKKYHGAEDGWLEAAARTRPFGRLIDPKEVARACAYLASDESGLMTGANIDFDQNVVGVGDPPLEP